KARVPARQPCATIGVPRSGRGAPACHPCTACRARTASSRRRAPRRCAAGFLRSPGRRCLLRTWRKQPAGGAEAWALLCGLKRLPGVLQGHGAVEGAAVRGEVAVPLELEALA